MPVHPSTVRLIEDSLLVAGHVEEMDDPLFRVITNPSSQKRLGISAGSIHRDVVAFYERRLGILS